MHVVGGNEDVVVVDAPMSPLHPEVLKERDARVAMRLLMSRHFRVTQRPIAEESVLRQRKLRELNQPKLERDYQKCLNVQAEETLRWKLPVRSAREGISAAYRPDVDERTTPIAASAPHAFGSNANDVALRNRGFMNQHYLDDEDEDEGSALFFSRPPSSAAEVTDDGSVLLQPPRSHLEDCAIPIQLHVACEAADREELEQSADPEDDFDRGASPRDRN
jgi:hypothetical protein